MFIEEPLFKINSYRALVPNFQQKKQLIIEELENHPEERNGAQNFYTNKQSERINLKDIIVNILKEDFEKLSDKLDKDIMIEDVWSVSYRKGDYHTAHNHGSPGYTGILYLDFDKDATVTTYVQPWNDIESNTTIHYPYPVSEGMMMVVPKFVTHFTRPSTSENIKRVLVWDMKII
jgi:hypothetical protein